MIGRRGHLLYEKSTGISCAVTDLHMRKVYIGCHGECFEAFGLWNILHEGTVYADSGKYSILNEQRNPILFPPAGEGLRKRIARRRSIWKGIRTTVNVKSFTAIIRVTQKSAQHWIFQELLFLTLRTYLDFAGRICSVFVSQCSILLFKLLKPFELKNDVIMRQLESAGQHNCTENQDESCTCVASWRTF